MRADDEGPRPLAWSLRRLAKAVKRVDLTGFGAVEAVWDEVPAAAASGAAPLRLAGGELVVSVASGAHASRARRDAAEMLAQLASKLEVAPRTLRVVVRSGPRAG
jgi:hypothetical protein